MSVDGVLARLSTPGSSLSRLSDEAFIMDSQDTGEVELRCPIGPKKLFAKLRLSGEKLSITSGNLIEISCQDCKRRFRSQGSEVLVLHRFDIAGVLVETVIVEPSS